ncbi:MAG: hypothetical protein WC565_10225 [Parcubacteria group bacterium]
MTTIIQLTLIQLLSGVSLLVLLFGLLQWALATWISIRLEQSIQHEYNKKIEDYRFRQLQRQKAEIIARLFSKWIKYRGNEDKYLDKKELVNFYEELNQMSLEISIWIEDVELLRDVMARLQLKDGAKNVRDLAGQIRKLILKNPEDQFDPQDIVLWPNSETASKLFL